MMKKFTIQDGENPLVHISLFIDGAKADINDMLDQISDDPDIGFAGFRYKDGLREHLKWELDEIKDTGHIDENKTKLIIEKTIKKCLSVVNAAKPVHIFIFPTFSEFVKEKMNGVTGYSPWRNTILIYINPVNGWDISLKNAICHEFAHAIAQNYNELRTILDQLVFDGIAEHFREAVVGGGRAPWAQALTEDEAKKILGEIRGLLDSDDNKVRREIFYGAGRYPLWAGYSIGYYIADSFLKSQESTDWNGILKISPERIFEESEFSAP